MFTFVWLEQSGLGVGYEEELKGMCLLNICYIYHSLVRNCKAKNNPKVFEIYKKTNTTTANCYTHAYPQHDEHHHASSLRKTHTFQCSYSHHSLVSQSH